METVASIHSTYYILFKYSRFIEIHMKGFQKVRTFIALIRKLADMFCGHLLADINCKVDFFVDISVGVCVWRGEGVKILKIEMSDRY